jgi:AraC family transcriptional regulator of adaptative response / DNA-3-methyladenine glycosylase II
MLSPEELPMPRSRGRALIAMCDALATKKVVLDPGSPREETAAALQELPGIGSWTTSYIAMRGLSDPDAFMASDLGLRHALEHLGLAGGPRDALARAQQWRPWRAYALQHLWASLGASGKAPANSPSPMSAMVNQRTISS